jgi:hypothetical protein
VGFRCFPVLIIREVLYVQGRVCRSNMLQRVEGWKSERVSKLQSSVETATVSFWLYCAKIKGYFLTNVSFRSRKFPTSVRPTLITYPS